MGGVIVAGLKRRILVFIMTLAVFGGGVVAFTKLNIEAYPDPVPPLVDIIVQSPGSSAEEMERYMTIPVERDTRVFGRHACARVMKRTQMLNAAYTLDSIFINQAGTGSALTHAANLTSFYELVPDATGDDWGWSLGVRPMEDNIGYSPPASLGPSGQGRHPVNGAVLSRPSGTEVILPLSPKRY